MFGLIFIVAALLTPQLAGCLTKKVVVNSRLHSIECA